MCNGLWQLNKLRVPVVWRIRNKLSLSVAGVLAAGCTSLVPVSESNRVWIGRPLQDLVAAWGAPVQSFNADDGGSIHSWSMTIVRYRRTEECRRSVLVDREGLVRQWLYDTCPRPQPRRDS